MNYWNIDLDELLENFKNEYEVTERLNINSFE